MGDIIQESFSLNLKIMRFLFLYPLERNRKFYLIQAYLVYFFVIVLIPTLALLYSLTEEEVDIVKRNYTATFLAETFSFITKLLPFIKNSAEIRSTIIYFSNSYFKTVIHTKKQKKYIENCINICRTTSLVWVSGITVGLICFNMKPFFENDRKLPLELWLPFDIRHSGMYYFAYFFTSMGVSYAAFAGSIIDPLIGGLASHAASQLSILRDNLQNLNEIKFGKNEEKIYNKIRQCVEHHNKILIFVKKYEESFSLVVFSQIAASVFAICFSCLSFSVAKTFSFNAVFSLLVITITLGQIFFYCYYGTQLFEENNNLATSIYMGNWYEYDTKCKKALFILMERSKRPMIVTSGKIIQLTLDTFAVVLKRSYSLLAILKNFQ